MPADEFRKELCDVAIVGSGAAGLVAALTAASEGLRTVVLEKTHLVGGTTARSEGMIWVPLSRQARQAGIVDAKSDAVRYLEAASDRTNPGKARAFSDNAERMLAFIEANSPIRYELDRDSIDYYENLPGALKGGRALRPMSANARSLGIDLERLRPPLASTMILGGMAVASSDIPDYLAMTRSLPAFLRVARRVAVYFLDRARGLARGARITGGNALVASLLVGAERAGASLRTNARVVRLIRNDERLLGLEYRVGGKTVRLRTRYGVIIAAGGASNDPSTRSEWFPHVAIGGVHESLTPPDAATGDGVRLALAVGAALDRSAVHAAAWTPVSLVPQRRKRCSPFPHYIDRAKPGIIAVDDSGRRFTNEADPYQDFTADMIAAVVGRRAARFFVVCDSAAIKRYGLGAAPPSPGNRRRLIKNGYLLKARTLRQLAFAMKVDSANLIEAAQRMSAAAQSGVDPDFGKGASDYNKLNGDPEWAGPNPCLGPVKFGPFYAVRLYPGDIATFYGLRTDPDARVLDESGGPINGLYAAGSDASTVAGGAYPAAGMTIGPAMTFSWLAVRDMIRDRAAIDDRSG